MSKTNKPEISRKDFIKSAAIGMLGMAIAPGYLAAKNTDKKSEKKQAANFPGVNYTLKNVRLETGFEYDGNEIIATKTDLFMIEIKDDKITKISPNQPLANAFDAKGRLMLPSFKDMHIHLDKTQYGDGWKAIRQRHGGGIKEIIALEQRINRQLLVDSAAKAEKIIELLQSKGTAFARSQVNIEPTSKLDSLNHLLIALEDKKRTFGAETVAFPQHGIYYTNSAPYMEEAAKIVDFIGGIDPVTIDGSLEKPMDFMVKLALDNHKGIDMHSHETGPEGLKAVHYLIDKVNENPVLKGKTAISHCLILGALKKKQQEELAEKLAAADIQINSTVPFSGGFFIPIPLLMEKGVRVYAGNDTILDHWTTFGTGSVLEKANLAARLYRKYTEFDLSRLLKLATRGILPLDDKGEQQWPKVGDTADLAFLDASCSAEAVARISPVKSLIYHGNIVY